jgi:hypothetical protein
MCVTQVFFSQRTAMAFSDTNAFKKLMSNSKPTQLEFYTKNGASENITRLIPLSNKAFGEGMQRIISEMFGFDPPTDTGHDAVYKGHNIEIKSARYWSGSLDCKWQHIMEDHNYKYVLLALVDFQDLKFWILSKEAILANPKIFTQQGNAEGQGRWCSMKNVVPVCRPVASREDLDRVIFAE